MDVMEIDAQRLTVDPVCGREITPGRELFIAECGDKVLPFCSEHCRMLFALHQERYVEEQRPPTP